MSEFRVHLKRRLRNEIYSFVLMMAIPSALAIVFPYEAIGFRAVEPPESSAAHCAFVTLTAAEERLALTAARAAWQVNAEGVRGLRADLSVGELQPTPMVRVLGSRTFGETDASRATVYEPSVLPPSVGAPEPTALPMSEEGVRTSAFTRDDLLRID